MTDKPDMITVYRRNRKASLKQARRERAAGNDDNMHEALQQARFEHAQVFNRLLFARLRAEREAALQAALQVVEEV